MQICLNGVACETQAVVVADLIHERGLAAERVAVVLNDGVVPAAARATTRLNSGDRVDLLAFVAGG